MDTAAQLNIEQARAARTTAHPRHVHLCAYCRNPVPLASVRAEFDRVRLEAARDACAYCLDAYPCEVHR